MRAAARARSILAVTVASLLVACGGGGADQDVAGAGGERLEAVAVRSLIASDPLVVRKTQIVLHSDAGDFVGDGATYAYDQSNAVIAVAAHGGTLSVRIAGDELWFAQFSLPATQSVFRRGAVRDVSGFPLINAATGGMQWSGNGRTCSSSVSTFRINGTEFAGQELVALDMDFVQHCGGALPALRGSIRWFADDATRPRGPAREAPASLWSPAPGATPTAGSFVYLESDPGEYVVGGGSFLYTRANAELEVRSEGARIVMNVTGDRRWSGVFQPMNVVQRRLRPGWYAGLQDGGFNPTRGGLSWSGEHRICDGVAWVVVDEVSYVDNKLALLDMRFELRCGATAPALHGRVRWDASDTTRPRGPRAASPDALWAPADGTTPAEGNSVYLQSTPGDPVGGGTDTLYTSGISASTYSGRELWIDVDGQRADFRVMSSIRRLKPGFYRHLQQSSMYNPAFGGFNWVAFPFTCGATESWVAIDTIAFDETGALAAVDLRFKQVCDGGPPLYGAVHWVRPS